MVDTINFYFDIITQGVIAVSTQRALFTRGASRRIPAYIPPDPTHGTVAAVGAS